MHTRRSLLQFATLGAATGFLTGCERTISELTKAFGQGIPDTLTLPQGTEIDPDFHLLSRAAFGPWPGDLTVVKKMGRKQWIEEQLNPDSINDELCELRARRFESLYFQPGDAYEFKKPVLRNELTRHAMLKAIYSRRQLFEVMVEFWTDHLNIDLEKGDCIYFKPTDDREVIRKHALGNFHDLIRASATSPAMLVYLDGRSNRVTKDKPVPNENYAREIMELHTLGVHGGYTQTDIREAARCLSGWTVNLLKDKSGGAKRGPKGILQRFNAPARGVSFFNAEFHDDGEKKVLGQTIPAGGGEGDLDALVRILCRHPNTARFIAQKLCVRFVSYNPPPALVDRVAAEFTRTGGDIKAMLRLILNSDEFLASRGTLTKRPFRFIVSSLRALAADTHVQTRRNNHGPLLEYLGRMGQGLFQYPTPDGYPDEEAPWMGTLLWRWNFAMDLASGKMSGDVTVPLEDLQRALGNKLGRTDAESQRQRWFTHLTGRLPKADELQTLAEVTASNQTNKARTDRLELEESLGVMLACPAFQKC